MPKKPKRAASFAEMSLAEVFDVEQKHTANLGGQSSAMPKKLTAAKKRKQASVNPAASAWTREQKIEKLSVVIAATMDALELPPRMRLKITAK